MYEVWGQTFIIAHCELLTADSWLLTAILLLSYFRAITAAALFAVGDALAVEHTAHNMITNTRKILDASAANNDHRVLLQVMTDAGNVRVDFHLVGQTYFGDLTQSRVRFFGSHGTHLSTHTAFKRVAFTQLYDPVFQAVKSSLESRRFTFTA